MRKILSCTFVLMAALPLSTTAAEPQNFLVTTTQDLATLCTVEEADPMRDAALHFCHGYLVGAYHYHLKSNFGRDPMFCLPDPPPSRSDAVDRFMLWTSQHSELGGWHPLDAFLRWLVETFPCKS